MKNGGNKTTVHQSIHWFTQEETKSRFPLPIVVIILSFVKNFSITLTEIKSGYTHNLWDITQNASVRRRFELKSAAGRVFRRESTAKFDVSPVLASLILLLPLFDCGGEFCGQIDRKYGRMTDAAIAWNKVGCISVLSNGSLSRRKVLDGIHCILAKASVS